MLVALYTDSSAHSHLGTVSKIFGRLLPESIQRLSRRIVKGVPKQKIVSFDYPALRKMVVRSKGPSVLHVDKQYGDWAAERMIRRGAADATHVYSMNRSGLEFVKFAKTKGCKSVIDIFISPSTERVMREESENFPDWGATFKDAEYELGMELWKKTAETGDLLLCPSEWVAKGIREVSPESSGKIRIVPYGCSINYQGRRNSPVPGRVLFAGGDALRKGLHYLAQAASVLEEDIPNLDIRVAGGLPPEVLNHPVAKSLNFLGKLTSEQMKEEYLSADMFVLPSLSEGFAGVVAEAIGAGCPVVVTNESGSPIVHEREGLIVPSANVDALADAIRMLITDRQLRDECSKNCIQQIPFYAEDAWKRRLIDAIHSIG